MPFVIAQVSDVHIGGPHDGSGERLSMAIDAINAITRTPDLVLLTGDLTHNARAEEWQELSERLEALRVPWEAIAGNHDHGLGELAGHRTVSAGPLRLVLIDSSSEQFTDDDASWLEEQLAVDTSSPAVIAIHHPPFETGIWWMDCAGLTGMERLEAVVRRSPHVIAVLSGHVHRPIHTSWGPCSLWVSPSTSVAVAVDLDPAHDPAESAEPPSFSLHAFTGSGIVSHVVPVGPAAMRRPIEPHAAAFVARARAIQRDRHSEFA